MSSFRSSSTRTELGAGILRHSAPPAVHQATDSMAYVTKITELLNGIVPRRKRPWGIQTDGDLWAIMDKIIKVKGSESIKVTWVKGHATQKHIDEGTSTPLLKQGNDKADNLANKGVQEHVGGVMQLAAHYAAKQRRYTMLIKKIHDMFLRVVTLERAKHKQKTHELSIFKKVIFGTEIEHTTIPQKYTAPDWGVGMEVDMQACTKDLFNENDQDRFRLSVWLFIKNMRWQPTTGQQNGTSWVELFGAFQSIGGRMSLYEPLEGIEIQAGFKKQLEHFTKK
jgi:ribonuclease HI